MEKFLVFCLVAVTFAADFVFAGTFYHVRTELGSKLGEIRVDPSKLFYQTLNGGNHDTKKSISVSIAFPTGLGEPLSQMIDSSPTYIKYRAYVTLTTGSDMFDRGAPLYGNVQANLKNPEAIQSASRVLRSPSVKIEVFEGQQNRFFYMESSSKGRPIYDADDCTYDLNSPLWTLRFSANGESFDVPYSRSGTVVQTGFRTEQVLKLFPQARHVEINGQAECLQHLKDNQRNPLTYEHVGDAEIAH